jgi:hypothetical protein
MLKSLLNAKMYRDVQKVFSHNDGMFTFENESSKVQMLL